MFRDATHVAFRDLTNNAPVRCAYCGAELKKTKVEVMGRTYLPPVYGSCGCCQSKEQMENRGLTEKEKRERKYLHAGIGAAYLEARNPRPELFQALKNGRCVYLYGGVGAGKTYTASALSKLLIDRNKSVKFRTVGGILQAIKDEQFSGDVLLDCVGCDYLVLDDIGKEKLTEWALSVLFEIVNTRYSNNLPIIATSNYRPLELAERLSEGNTTTAEAIVSRLATGEQYDLGDKDMRC